MVLVSGKGLADQELYKFPRGGNWIAIIGRDIPVRLTNKRSDMMRWNDYKSFFVYNILTV